MILYQTKNKSEDSYGTSGLSLQRSTMIAGIRTITSLLATFLTGVPLNARVVPQLIHHLTEHMRPASFEARHSPTCFLASSRQSGKQKRWLCLAHFPNYSE